MGCQPAFRVSGVAKSQLAAFLAAGVDVIVINPGEEGPTSTITGGDSESGGRLRLENGNGTWIENELDVEFGIFAGGSITAGLLSRTPSLPPWDDAANPAITAGDTGGTFRFTGGALLPDASTLPENWQVTLIFASANATCSTDGGNILSPDGNFNSNAILENGASGFAVLKVICDGTNYIAASQTGTIQNI